MYMKQINNNILLYNTEYYIQYFVINYNGKEPEKDYMYSKLNFSGKHFRPTHVLWVIPLPSCILVLFSAYQKLKYYTCWDANLLMSYLWTKKLYVHGDHSSFTDHSIPAAFPSAFHSVQNMVSSQDLFTE